MAATPPLMSQMPNRVQARAAHRQLGNDIGVILRDAVSDKLGSQCRKRRRLQAAKQ
jgi:hypothetical protein